MEKSFTAYDGADPYLFVSYSHKDRANIYREMSWLYEAGFNLWYDEDIAIGSVWRESLTAALAEASGCLFFVTENSVLSDNCLREINFAIEEGIKVFYVRLDDAELPRQLRFSLSDQQALVRSEYSEATFRTQLSEALARLTVRGPTRILERLGSPTRYRTQVPLLCINPFSCPDNDGELRFYARSVATDIGRCMFSSSFYITEGQLEDAMLKPQEVGRKHRAQYVLNGTLMRTADGLRSSVRVSETTHGKQVWVKNTEPEGSSLPEKIDILASEIAADVSFTFWQYDLERVQDIPEQEQDAWGLSIRSMSMQIRDFDSAAESLRLARLAVERDDGFAEAHANLADVIVNLIIARISHDVGAYSEEALVHCNKALMLNKNAVYILNRCSRAHRVLGNEAIALQLARRVDSLTNGEFTYTLYPALILNNKAQEVVELAKSNPNATYSWASDASVITGEFESAELWMRTSVARTPASYMGWMRLANILGHQNMLAEAREILIEVDRLSPPGWSIKTYEESLQLNWRGHQNIIEPLINGLKNL